MKLTYSAIAKLGVLSYSFFVLNFSLKAQANLDSDGDGIINTVDLDDDNDGILDEFEYAPVFCSSSPSCIINASLYSVTQGTGSNPTGWTAYGNGGSPDVSQGNWHVMTGQVSSATALFPYASSGSYFIYGMSKNGSGTLGGWAPYGEALQQTLTCLVPGNFYTVTFKGAITRLSTWTSPWTAPTKGNFVLLRDGTQVAVSQDINLEAQAQTITLTFMAVSTSHTIAIGHMNPLSTDLSLMVIQAGSGTFCNGTVVATNDLDTDGDGIPNRLDLDSDGDGCSDAFEGGATLNKTDSLMTTPFGANGFADNKETVAGNGQSNFVNTYNLYAKASNRNACLDSDNDGIVDIYDIDDDNDGIKDTDEVGNCIAPDNSLDLLMENSNVFANCAGNIDGPGIDFYGFSLVPYSGSKYLGFHYGEVASAPIPASSPIRIGVPYKIKLATANASINAWNSDYPTQMDVYAGTASCGQSLLIGTTSLIPAPGPTGSTSTWFVDEFSFTPTANYTHFTFVPKQAPASTNFGYMLMDGIEVGYYTSTAVCDSLNDIDKDGVINSLDLDSDGDGCTDAFEGGSTLVQTDSIIAGPYGTNGLANSKETAADNGIVNYTLQYSSFATTKNIATCKDFDNDGISDLIDIDDDNDGVLDATESPSCFYNASEWLSGNRIHIVPSTSLAMNATYNSLSKLDDGDNGTAVASYAVQFVATTTAQRTVYAFDMSMPVEISKIYLGYVNTNTHFNASTFLKLQGSNDNTNWTNLNDSVAYSTTTATNGITNIAGVGAVNANVFNVTRNSGRYRYYRIYWTNGGGINVNGLSNEVYFEVPSNYNANLNPKQSCSEDQDNDTKYNHIDLDSDGDGCSDAKESGATTSTTANFKFTGTMGTNGLDNSLETSADNGTINYTSYYYNALNNNLNGCIDTDNDGIADLIDIDDDNDGILDSEECPKVQLLSPNVIGAISYDSVVNRSTKLNYTYNGGSLLGLYDGNQSTYFNILGSDADKNLAIIDFYLTNVQNINQFWLWNDWGAGGDALKNFEVELYGSNGILNQKMANIALNETNTSSPQVFQFNQNGIDIKRIRLILKDWWSHTQSNSQITDIGFGYNQVECDTDGDGIPNGMDLDSDGDGCYDAFEAGSSLVQTDSIIAGPYGSNGLANSKETVADNGTINYTSVYKTYAISKNLAGCKDTDGDGVNDLVDIDDDNDGVLDATESPSCFYSASEWLSGNRSQISATTTLTMNATYNRLNLLDDGENGTAAANYAVQFLATTTPLQTVYSFDMTMPVEISKLYLGYVNTNTHFNANTFLKLQGSNDNATWINLNDSVAYSTTTATNGITNITGVGAVNANVFSVTKNPGRYRYFRIYWTNGGGININGVSNEVYFETPASYQASMNPKPTCSVDTDNDGVFNHLDLDSDGDGCSDAKEAGATTSSTINYKFTGSMGTNGLDNSLETSTDNGIINYASSYNFATSNIQNACLDSDSDGVGDLIDIDDDNDGIPDVTESICENYNLNEINCDNVKGYTPTTFKSFVLNNSISGTNYLGNGDSVQVTYYGTVQSIYTASQTMTSSNEYCPVSNDATMIQFLSGAQTHVIKFSKTVVNPIINIWSLGNPSLAVYYTFTTPIKITKNNGSLVQTNTTTFYGAEGNGSIILSGAYDSIVFTANTSENWTGMQIMLGNAYGNTSATNLNNYSCVDLDTDGDGIPNRIDLDSDNDGCFDSYEGGSSLIQSDSTISGPYGANGLANSKETVADNGTINYTSVYKTYAVSKNLATCKDTDGDGVLDISDIDDDNDGILDVTESPSCFYAASEWLSGNRTQIKANTSLAMNNTYNRLNLLNDGENGSAAANYAVQFNATTTAPASVYSFDMSMPVEISKLYLGYVNGNTHFNANTFLKLQGSNDNTTWINLNDSIAYNTTTATNGITNITGVGAVNANVFSVTKNPGRYRYYRIYWTNGGGININGVSNEVYFETLASYQASMNPKPTCSVDTDNDGVFNHLDLDSDGDGCSDAKEAGATSSTTPNFKFTGTMGLNGLDNSLETSADNGVTNYTSTYLNAILLNKNGCTDTDGDGIGDLIDLDDDNDGILDIEETNCINVSNSCEVFTNSNYSGFNLVKNGGFEQGNVGFTSGYIFRNASAGCSDYFLSATGWASSVGSCSGNLAMQLNADCSANQVPFWCQEIDVTPNTNYRFGFSMRHASVSYIAFSVDGGILSTPVPTTANWSQKEYVINSGSKSKIQICLYETSKVAGGADFVIDDIYLLDNSMSFCNDTLDTDGDGIPNRLDLDSDGDGCSDAYEGGSSLVQSDSIIAGPYGNNGLANSKETVADNGIINYISNYSIYATSKNLAGCKDTDGDGSLDLVDIDDDNDGVLDATESPNCFYSASEWLSGNRPHITANTTLAMNTTYNLLNKLDDGDNGTAASSYAVVFNATTIPQQTVYGFDMTMPVEISKLYLGYVNANTHFNANTFLKLQGSNDNATWINLNDSVAYNTTTATNGITNITGVGAVNANVFSVTKNPGRYRYYRIYWTNGGGINVNGYSNEVYFETPASYQASMNPKPACSVDTDNDGKFNHLDLDSDGDGCSDASEAGATTSTTANYTFSGPFGTNGLANSKETAVDNGIINYSSTYSPYAISKNLAGCSDTDGDGTMDMVDIDDDNDGVLDATESPSCFFSASDWFSGSREFITATTSLGMNTTYNRLNLLEDGQNGTAAANYAVQFNATTTAPATVYGFDMSMPVQLSRIYLGYVNTNTHFNANTFLKLQGSNDNASWTDLSDSIAYNTTVSIMGATSIPGLTGTLNNNMFVVHKNAAPYRYYRIYWTNGGGININGVSNEVYFETPTNYVASRNPKPSCSEDIDNDGKFNHQDVDADGDKCFDAFEAGATTSKIDSTFSGPYGTNGLANSKETVADNDIINYTSTYNSYGLSSLLRSCFDTDNDGINDAIDIDDDNDGILDAEECASPSLPLCFDGSFGNQTLISITSTGCLNTVNSSPDLMLPTWSNFAANTPYSPDSGAFLSFVYQKGFWDESAAFTLTNLTVGKQYRFKFYQMLVGQGGNWFDGGNILFKSKNTIIAQSTNMPATNTSGAGRSWQYQEVPFIADSTSMTITISGMSTNPNSTIGSRLAMDGFQIVYEASSCDFDGDGIINSLDLDSDNDGCKDAYEGGSTTSLTDSVISGPYGTNGLANSKETATDNGIINYTSKYSDYALSSSIKSCQDTDKDGVIDLDDIDDDNDGIPDLSELSCVSPLNAITPTVTGANTTYGTKTANYKKLSGTLVTNATTIYNQAITALDFAATSSASITLDTAFANIKLALADIDLSESLNLKIYDKSNNLVTLNTSNVINQGSYVNVLYTQGTSITLNAVGASDINYLTSDNSSVLLMIPNVAKRIEIYKTAGAAQTIFGIMEACDYTDSDNDGIPNQLDTDSDNDGCTDAFEGGSTTNYLDTIIAGPYGTNGLANSKETAIDNGIINYTLTYSNATNNNIKRCLVPDFSNNTGINGNVLNLCQQAGATRTLVASPTPSGTVATIKWYSAASGGTGSTSAPVIALDTPRTVSYWASQTVSGIEGPRAEIKVVVNAKPSMSGVAILGTAIASKDSIYTHSIPVVANATAYIWTLPSGWKGNSTTNSITDTAGSVGGYIYVKASNKGCVSNDSASLLVGIKPAMPSVAQDTIRYCQNDSTIQLSATLNPSNNGGKLKWYTAQVGGTADTIAPKPSSIFAGITTYWVSQTVNGVESDRKPIVVIVNPLLSPATAILGASSVTANTSYTYKVNPVFGAVSYTWTLPNGWTGSSTVDSIVVNTNNTTSGVISVKANSATCSGYTQSLTIANNTILPNNPDISGNTNMVGDSIVYCQGDTALQLTASLNPTNNGGTLKWYTSPTAGVGTTAAPTPSTSSPGTFFYFVSQTVNGVESNRAAIKIVVRATPAQPTAISGATSVLANSSQVYSVSPVSGATSYTWSYSNGSNWTGTSTTASLNATAGTSTVTISVVPINTTFGKTCNGTAQTLTVNIMPTQPDISGNTGLQGDSIVYCQGATATQLTASLNPANNGGTINWYTTPTGGTASTTAPTPNTAFSGTTYYYVSQTVNGVESSRAAIKVVVKPTPAQPTAISGNTAVLPFTSYIYSVNPVAGATSYTWTIFPTWTGSSTTNSITLTTDSTTSFTIKVTANFNGCSSPPTTLKIGTLPSKPLTGLTGDSIVYCQGATATQFSATLNPSNNGGTLNWYTVAVGGTASSIAPTPSTASAGTYYYYVSQTVNGTESDRAAIKVIVKATPNQPNSIIGNTSVSTNTSYTYSIGAVAGATSYTWTLPNGWTGSSTTNSISINTNTTTSGTISVTANVNGCSSQAQTLTVGSLPSNPDLSGNTGIQGDSIVYCQGATATQLMASLNPSNNGGKLKWYTSPIGGTGDTIAPTPSTTFAGITYYYVSQTVNGVESSRAAIKVVVKPVPNQPNSISGPTAVSANTNYTYSVGSVAGASSYTWTLPNGWTGSSTTNSISINTSTTTSGIVTVKANLGGCSSAVQTLNVGGAPAEPDLSGNTNLVGDSIVYCQNATASQLTASLNPLNNGGTINWYTTPTGGSASSVAPTPNTSSAGTYFYYVSQTVNSVESSRAAIKIVVKPAPNQPNTISGPSSVSANTSYTYSISSVSGATSYTWTLPNGWTGTSNTTSISVTTNSITSGVIYVTANVGSCSSLAQSKVIGTLPNNPTTNMTGDSIVYCQGATASQLVASLSPSNNGGSLNWYTVASGGTASATAPTPSTLTAGTTLYYVSQTVGGVESNRTIIKVVVKPVPAQASLTTTQPTCAINTATITINAPLNSAYKYSVDSINYSLSTTFSNLASGSRKVYVKDTITSCISSIATTINAAPAAPANPTVQLTQPSCQSATGSIVISAPTGSNYIYSIDSINYQSNPTFNAVTAGTYRVRVKDISANCATDTGTKAVINSFSGTPNQPSVISGPANPSIGSTVTYSIDTVAGATSYTWTVPTGWTISSGQNTKSISVVVGSTGGTITVKANNSSGCSSAAQTLDVNKLPAKPIIDPANSNIVGNTITYCQGTVASALRADSTVSGAMIKWYTGSDSSSASNAGAIDTGSVGPIPSTAVGNTQTMYWVSQTINGVEGIKALIIVKVNPTPSQPNAIVGNAVVLAGSNQIYSVNAVPGATSYTWTLPSGWSGTSTTNSISTTVGTLGGVVKVKANLGNCSSQEQTLTVNIKPSSPDITSNTGISGNTITYCQGATANQLSATAISGGTLKWYDSDGTTVLSSAPTPSTDFVQLKTYYVSQIVNGVESDKVAIVVKVNSAPSQPNPIQGDTLVTKGSSKTYTVSPVPGATSYTWTLPNGWTGTSTTNSITIVADSVGGFITVKANSTNCSSPIQTLTVKVKTNTNNDADGDGIPDDVEKGSGSTPKDTDGDGIPDYQDPDSDNDGIPDSEEDSGCTGISPCTPTDTDGDGNPDYTDTDSDNDGITDNTEKGGGTTPKDTDGDGIPDYRDPDSDGDGIPDSVEKGNGTTPKDTDGDGIPDYLDPDSDGDGIPDALEDTGCNGTAPCTPTDTDGDGTPDYLDTDSDGDGIPDNTEDTGCNGTVPCNPSDKDGDGIPNYKDTDSDGDGIPDSVEKGSGTTPQDSDGDGIPNYLDLDSDNDGILDAYENQVCSTPVVLCDTDGDGIPNYIDLDSDGDGKSDVNEANGTDANNDGKADGTPNADGVPNSAGGGLTPPDTNLDGKTDPYDITGSTDTDGDGIPDSIEKGSGTTPKDTDGDGIPDFQDLDSDNDGILDAYENSRCSNPSTLCDTDGDGVPNYLDLDSDGDGIRDVTEANGTDVNNDGKADGTVDSKGVPSSANGGLTPLDTDNDGKTNPYDTDSDGDGILDSAERGSGNIPVDTDGDGKPDYLDTDSDNDGIPDSVEKGTGTTPQDTDGDGIPNHLDLDSDNDGILDAYENNVCVPSVALCDVDGDGIPNYMDLDSDNDSIPDVIESNGRDDNNDGKADGASNSKGIPSSATSGNTPPNTDALGYADPYDLDSDNDGILDSIEKGSNGSIPRDTDGDGIPDYRDVDSDGDGNTDQGEGEISDCDGDGIPDYLDTDNCKDDEFPNYITPNGDGKNDNFVLPASFTKKYPNAKIVIYNRWGNIVWRSVGVYKNDWNGVHYDNEVLPDGVYYYVIELENEFAKIKTGFVQILRD